MVEKGSPRVEIDTSAPFDSVKEAASRFGEVGYWRRCSFQNKADVTEQATILQKEVIRREKETLGILKQLESSKSLIDELKSKLGLDESMKKAKFNVSRTTSDLTGIRSSVEKLNEILESENAYLKRAYDRIALNSSMMAVTELGNPQDSTEELRRLTREIHNFTKIGKYAEAEAWKTISGIEQTKIRIKAVEARTTAARNVEEAARSVESSATLKFKALSKDSLHEVSLTMKEYSNLKERSNAAEENAAAKITEALKLIDMAVTSKSEIVEKEEEVKKSKEVLEGALRRVDAANIEKMHEEETLRKRRPDRGNRRSQDKICHPTKVHCSELMPESALSIGEILRRKLSVREVNGKVKENRDTKRNKFEFGRFSGFLAKNTKKMFIPDLR